MKAEEFEKKIGKDLSDINMKDLNELMEQEDVMILLNDHDTAINACNKVLTENLDPEVRSEFAPVKYYHELYKQEEEIADIYNQYEVDKSPENFVNRIKEFNKTSTSVGRLVSYIMLLKNVEGLDLTGEKDHIIAAVDDVIHILNSLDFSKGIGTVCDMIDILYSIQQDYFEKYQVDVLDGRVNKLNEIVSKLNEIMKEYYNNELKKINEEIPDDAKPEDIGMLDVTKYKGVADDNTPNQK